MTIKTLEAIALEVKSKYSNMMHVLQIITPVASSLFHNDTDLGFEIDKATRHLRDLPPHTRDGGEDNEAS